MNKKDYIEVLDNKVKDFVQEFKDGYCIDSYTNRATLKNMLNSILRTVNELDKF